MTEPTASADAVSVVLDVWQVRPRDIGTTVVEGRRALQQLRRNPSVTFAKFLGTSGPSFQPWRATPRRWAMLTCWRHTPEPARRHSPAAVETATLRLRPLWSRGSWDGYSLGAPATRTRVTTSGPLLMLTRSSLRASRAARFYRAVTPIATDIKTAEGLRVAFGIGEAPLLRQGTISIWTSAEAMAAFARSSAAHLDAVRATGSVGWYDEELFAGLAIDSAEGSIDGVAL